MDSIVLHGSKVVKTFTICKRFSLGWGLNAVAEPIRRVFEADFWAGDRRYGICYTYNSSKGNIFRNKNIWMFSKHCIFLLLYFSQTSGEPKFFLLLISSLSYSSPKLRHVPLYLSLTSAPFPPQNWWSLSLNIQLPLSIPCVLATPQSCFPRDYFIRNTLHNWHGSRLLLFLLSFDSLLW